jgi:hypothetical protein
MPGSDHCAHQEPENRTAMRAMIEIRRPSASLYRFVHADPASAAPMPLSSMAKFHLDNIDALGRDEARARMR